jgi:hypothetical protein
LSFSPRQGFAADSLAVSALEALAALKLPSLRHFQAKVTYGAWLVRLVRAPWLPQLETLSIGRFSAARGSLAGAALPRLEALKLWDGSPFASRWWPDAATAASLAALALPKLSRLTAGVLGSRDLGALSGAAWWPRLERLVVSLDAEDDGGLAAVRALVGKPLPRLCSLTIESNPLCAEALRLLALFDLPFLDEFALGVRGVRPEEKSRCIGAARAILEAAPWRRQCGSRFGFDPNFD